MSSRQHHQQQLPARQQELLNFSEIMEWNWKESLEKLECVLALFTADQLLEVWNGSWEEGASYTRLVRSLRAHGRTFLGDETKRVVAGDAARDPEGEKVWAQAVKLRTETRWKEQENVSGLDMMRVVQDTVDKYLGEQKDAIMTPVVGDLLGFAVVWMKAGLADDSETMVALRAERDACGASRRR